MTLNIAVIVTITVEIALIVASIEKFCDNDVQVNELHLMQMSKYYKPSHSNLISNKLINTYIQ